MISGMDIVGTSGAHVFVDDHHAVKWSSARAVEARIDAQSTWLVRHGRHEFLPHVHELRVGWYRMERLTEMPDFVDDEVLTRVIVSRLRKLWDEPADHAFDPGAHLGYVTRRAAPFGLDDRMAAWWRDTLPDLRPSCLVHGDPTYDNCMLRGGGELVITDPIPPDDRMPSVRALDIGKVIQSAMGYEEVARGRRGTTMPWPDCSAWEDLLPDVDHEEWLACLYFAAVHFLRLMPYTPQHEREWLERVRHLLGMRDRWTR